MFGIVTSHLEVVNFLIVQVATHQGLLSAMPVNVQLTPVRTPRALPAEFSRHAVERVAPQPMERLQEHS